MRDNPSQPKPVSVLPHVLRLLDPAGDRGVLLATRCRRCGVTDLGVRRYCVNCTETDVRILELPSEGTLVNYTVVYRAGSGWEGGVPYVLGVAENPEGVRVTTEVVDCNADQVRLGMPVQLTMRVEAKDSSSNPVVVYKWTPSRQSK